MHRRHAVVLLALLAASTTASAETLLVDRVHQENTAAMPTRGMTMAQVEARFGAPGEKLDPRGGQKRQRDDEGERSKGEAGHSPPPTFLL